MITPKPIQACVFDAYGTLFDVHSAVARHATAIGPQAESVSKLWRTKQLEYSWTRSLMHHHADFWTVTGESLDFALASHRLDNRNLRNLLMDAYRTLRAFPEVPDMLTRLKEQGVQTCILSNGSPAMLDDAVQSAGLAALVDLVLSIEDVGTYKPDPEVYAMMVRRLGMERGAISFQSSNPWDAAAASLNGLQVVWVNRGRQPREYGWALRGREIPDLASFADIVRESRTGGALVTRGHTI